MFRFKCTGCGKCCRGWLPVTLRESLDFSSRSPLAVMWHLHGERTPQFQVASRHFGTIEVKPSLIVAPWIRPVVFIPPAENCVHLRDDGLCDIHHAGKPLRCRTMPFLTNVPLNFQEPYLVPRQDWECFNPPDGTPVYDRGQFLSAEYKASLEAEMRAYEADAPLLKRHAADILAGGGESLLMILAQISRTPGGHLILPWSRLLRFLPKSDVMAAAASQTRIIAERLNRPAEAAEIAYRSHYSAFAEDLAAFSVSP